MKNVLLKVVRRIFIKDSSILAAIITACLVIVVAIYFIVDKVVAFAFKILPTAPPEIQAIVGIILILILFTLPGIGSADEDTIDPIRSWVDK
jgi:hypothetical protein